MGQDATVLLGVWKRLSRADSEAALIELLPVEICACGFDRAVVFSLTENVGRPVSACVAGDPVASAQLLDGFSTAGLSLAGMPAETEMLRRGEPTLVRIDPSAPRSLSRLARALDSVAYVAAPAVVGTRPALMLHADRRDGRSLHAADADRLGLIAVLVGRLLEQSASRRRIATLRAEVRRAAASARLVLEEQLNAPLDLAPTVQVGYGLIDGRSMGGWYTAPSEGPQLTRREREVMECVAAGLNNLQIAERLVISEQTVRSHLKRILRKLRASNRAEAVARWISLAAQSIPSGPSSEPSRN